MKRPNIKTAAAVSIAGCLAAAGHAQAGPQHNCDNYAAFAISDIQNAKSNACGFTGNRWVDNYNAHKNWCRQPSTTMAMLTAEDKARKNSLNTCIVAKANKPSDSDCKHYAQVAITQATFNIAKKCGNQGGGWHIDYQKHYSWCKTTTKAKMNAETSFRAGKLKQCS